MILKFLEIFYWIKLEAYIFLTFWPLWIADNDSDRRLLLWIRPSVAGLPLPLFDLEQ